MEKEFLALMAIGLATLVFAFIAAAGVVDFEFPAANETVWEVCERADKAFEWQRDCELLKALVDANLMEAG